MKIKTFNNSLQTDFGKQFIAVECSVQDGKGLFHEIFDKVDILGDTLQLGNVVRK
jgi:hypothetical protein